MTNKEAIEILKRLQDPEPWEPPLNSAAYGALNMAIAALEKRDELAADVVEVKHATWLIHGFSCPCSVCGYDLGYAGTPLEPTLAFFKYCPNCGAKMDGGADDAAD